MEDRFRGLGFPPPFASLNGSNYRESPIRYVVVIDGEHYPSVTAAALATLRAAGHDVAAAVLVGGKEKLPAGGIDALDGLPITTDPNAGRALEAALDAHAVDAVVDLSDEPVLDYRRRHSLASIALYKQVAYQGADFRFVPPPRPRLCAKPSIAVIATGKRTGKTAVAAFLARSLREIGARPAIVAMGRGGPPEPEVLRGDEIDLHADDLVAFADQGKHAASDYIEDALLARVPTVGCRRCGGGLAGGVEISNVARGIELGNALPVDTLILEGSGAAIPPAHADVTVLVVPASIDEEYLRGYLGPYRLLLADLVMVTMCEEPFGSPSRISRISSLMHEAFRTEGRGPGSQGEIQVIRSVFRPTPTTPVDGRNVMVATTAPVEAGRAIAAHLTDVHGCNVTGITHALSDRAKLEEELKTKATGNTDTLLCEIKAAAIDVAARRAGANGWDVVFMDNVPVGVGGDDPSALATGALERARDRFEDGGT